MFLRNLACLFALSAAGSLAADEKTTPVKDPAKKIVGVWAPAKATLAGKEMPAAVLEKMRLEVKGKAYKVTTAEGEDEGSLEFLLDQKPWGIDVVGENGPNKGKKFPSIFAFEGETLRICYDLSQKRRPKEFASKKGTLLFLVEYKRVDP